MRLLVVRHVPRKNPSYVAAYAKERGAEVVSLPMWELSDLVDPTGFDAVLLMGGTMNVHDEFPFLQREIEFVKTYHNEVPIFGICLGAQLIAHALGASVTENSNGQEVGVLSVDLTAEGKTHRLFQDFAHTFPVLQWHGYTFGIPEGATRLATNTHCENQAFVLGRSAGIQFHLDIPPALAHEIYEEGGVWARSHPEFNEESFLRSLDLTADDMQRQFFMLLDNFLAFAKM